MSTGRGGDEGAGKPAAGSHGEPPVGRARERLTEARAKLLLRHPFFGYLVANLEDRVVETSASEPTLEAPKGAAAKPPSVDPRTRESAGTDGTLVLWNKGFVERAPLDDVMFVLAHEALHCALQHPWRRELRDERDWDDASDIVVNDMLLDAGLRTGLPVLRGAKGRSVEKVYEEIAVARKSNPGKENVDSHALWGSDDKADPKERLKADVWRAVIAQAREFGSVPESLAREVTALLEPKRDWRDLLREGLFFPEDYRWTPSDRRFSDVLLPTLAGEVHRVVLAVDTSGSIQGARLEGFWAELVAILRNNRCEARVLACDAAVQNEWDEHEFDPSLVRALQGGGGTSFVPVFERVDEYVRGGWRPEALVYLTDLDGTFPPHAPEYRTLWVVDAADAHKRVPFGDVVAL